MKSFSKDPLELYYTCNYDRNVGRIKGIDGLDLIINVNAGHGGGEMRVPIDSCVEFDPKLGDRILLCCSRVSGKVFLKKLSKNREN